MGGRFLTDEEAVELLERVGLDEYEITSMNLEHLHSDQGDTDVELAVMTHADLVRLLAVARDLRYLAERSEELAERIDTYAWDLWSMQKERDDAR